MSINRLLLGALAGVAIAIMAAMRLELGLDPSRRRTRGASARHDRWRRPGPSPRRWSGAEAVAWASDS
jgi:hypothetical protein